VLVVSDICEETLFNCVKRAGAVDLVPRGQVVSAIMRYLDHDRKDLELRIYNLYKALAEPG